MMDLWGVFRDHPLRVLGSLTKFGWNPFSSFCNMKFLNICAFGWEMAIYAPTFGVLWQFDSLNGEQYQRNPQKAHSCVETRIYRSLKSDHWCERVPD